jgi:hypothetical protein
LPTILSRIDENVPEGGRGLNQPGSEEIVMMHADTEFQAFKEIMTRILCKGLAFTLPEFAEHKSRYT